MSSGREAILALLGGDRQSPAPCFSGLVHVTAAGLAGEGIRFPEAHRKADQMRRLAASTHKLAGFPSTAVPFDLCVEAEALGGSVDFRREEAFDFPRVVEPAYETPEALREVLRSEGRRQDFVGQGRIPIICEAIDLLKADIGGKAVISGIIPGPFTVLSMLLDQVALFRGMKSHPDQIHEILSLLSSFLSMAGRAYQRAGADFVTIHEMGGSPGVLGARGFEQFVYPALVELVAALPSPRVLAVCGKVDEVAALLAEAHAEALSIDQFNDLLALRAALPNTLLFGNLDPVGTLSLGTPEQVRAARHRAIQAGADAVWPGCDLMLETPIENLRVMSAAE